MGGNGYFGLEGGAKLAMKKSVYQPLGVVTDSKVWQEPHLAIP